MATYKVIQDIEAEDKLIGWMTPRQTIYAAIVIVSGFIGFMLSTNGAWWLAIFLLPHMALFSLLAGPFVHDQPSETWLLAKIQFFLKPKRRIWNQTGTQELVTITVPKKIERRLTDGLSQNEVKSKLSALANTLDSRGWAVKNINTNMFSQPSYANAVSDRLVDSSTLPQEVDSFAITAQDDILDERNNPVAQHLDQMISQSSQAHRQQLVQQMQQPVSNPTAAAPWFMNAAAQQTQPVANPSTSQTSDPTALLDKIQKEKQQTKDARSHMRTIKTADERQHDQLVQQQAAEAAKKPVNPAVQQLASNNDLNVSTIARQVNKQPGLDDGEVVISLH